MAERRQIESDLKQLNALIEEAEKRLGAHSVKPILMQQLFELEERRDALLQALRRLDQKERRGA